MIVDIIYMRNFITTVSKAQWQLWSVINRSKSVMELILMVYLDKKIWSYEFAVKGKEKGNKLLSSSCYVPPTLLHTLHMSFHFTFTKFLKSVLLSEMSKKAQKGSFAQGRSASRVKADVWTKVSQTKKLHFTKLGGKGGGGQGE